MSRAPPYRTRIIPRKRKYTPADDRQCPPGDFDDYEDWMTGPIPDDTPQTSN